MGLFEIHDLVVLQDLDALVCCQNGVASDMLERPLTPEERRVLTGGVITAMATSGLSDEELHLLFHRAALDAVRSWNATQSFFGRIKNAMTVTMPGYAEVPGRALRQARLACDEAWSEDIAVSASWWVRADVANRYREHFKRATEAAQA